MRHPSLPIIPASSAEVDRMRGERFILTRAGRDVLDLLACVACGAIRCALCGEPIDDDDEFTIVGGPMVPIHDQGDAHGLKGCAAELSNRLRQAEGPLS